MPEADVVIVGAGLAGCALAWHLAPHRRVLLLEQGEQPGAEASAQNAGMVRTLGEDPWERALALRTDAWLAEPGEDWAEANPSRIVGALLALATDREHLHDAVAHLRARGRVVEAVHDPARLLPALRGSPLDFAWFQPDARVADPWSMVAGFLRGARRHGATLRRRALVVGLRVEGGRVIGVETEQGTVYADQVVLAAGAWTSGLVAAHGLHRPLTPLRRTLIQTHPHAASQPDHPWVWVDDEGIYARPEGGGWLISGCDERVDWPAPGPGSAGPLEAEIWANAQDKLARFFPALADAAPSRGWSGLRTFAPDRRPVLGADPALPGLWWLAGLGGFGLTCGYAAAEAVATWMRGERTPWLNPTGVSPARPWPSRWPVRGDGRLAGARLHAVSGPVSGGG